MLELVAFLALGLDSGGSPYAKAEVVVSQPDSVTREWWKPENRVLRLERSIRLQLRLGKPENDPIIQLWKEQLEQARREQREIQRRVRPK